MKKLITSNNPVLKTKSEDWNFDTDLDPALLEQSMIETMQQYRGSGLAANQIGLLKRVFVIQLKNNADVLEPFAMFNPKLISSSTEVTKDVEGCLSFPDLWLEVNRPQNIEVEFLDKHKNVCKMNLTNHDARCFLHELDHLDGICFTDKVSQLKLTLAKKKQRKYNGRTK